MPIERVYAFTDEYGAFGWDIDNPSVSTHFIITAVIVKESSLDECKEKAEKIRKKFFQTGEIKSSKIGTKHARRKKVVAALEDIPFRFFSVCIDKKTCLEKMSVKGIKYKHVFYKFMNNIMHRELKRAFPKLTIVADEVGSNDYMESFYRYFEKKQDVPSLFGEANLRFINSKNEVLVQVADLISGTLAYVFDRHKKASDAHMYLDMLENKIIRIEPYPKTIDNYILEESAIAEDYDKDIAMLCFKQAAEVININNSSEDIEIKGQVIVLEYLLFRFMNNNTRDYIFTNELIKQLNGTELENISVASFRMRIIGKLRDKNVIIASSNRGYKIPSKRSEVYDFINHDANIVIPMLARLKKCRDLVKLSTVGELDLLDHDEYKDLKKFFDLQDKECNR